jgi:hypothetical protein
LIQTILEGIDNLIIKQQIENVYGNMESIRQSINQLPNTAPYNESELQSIKKRLNQMKEINEQLYYIKNYLSIMKDIEVVYRSQLEDISKVIDINVNENISKRSSRFPGARIHVAFQFLSKFSSKTTDFLNYLKTNLSNKEGRKKKEQTRTAYDDMLEIKSKYLSRLTDFSLFMKNKFGSNSSVVVSQAKPILQKYTEAINVKLQKDTSGIGPELAKFFGMYVEPVVAIPIEKEETNTVIALDEVIEQLPQTNVFDFTQQQTNVEKVIESNRSLLENITKENVFSQENSETPLSKLKENPENRGTIENTAKKVMSRISKMYKGIRNVGFTRKRMRQEGGRKNTRKNGKSKKSLKPFLLQKTQKSRAKRTKLGKSRHFLLQKTHKKRT